MIKLIVGGAFQGKTEYVKRTYGINEEEMTDGAVCQPEDCFSSRCVRGLHLLVRRMVEGEFEEESAAEGIAPQKTPLTVIGEIVEKNPDLIVITNEIGCGIIPLDRTERHWREWAGRVNCYLAEHADAVVRITCGLPVILKNEGADQ